MRHGSAPMTDPAPLIHPERWVSEWRAIGGGIFLGEGPDGEGGRAVDVLTLGPSRLRIGSDDWRTFQRLKRMIESRSARRKVLDYLTRRNATAGQDWSAI